MDYFCFDRIELRRKCLSPTFSWLAGYWKPASLSLMHSSIRLDSPEWLNTFGYHSKAASEQSSQVMTFKFVQVARNVFACVYFYLPPKRLGVFIVIQIFRKKIFGFRYWVAALDIQFNILITKPRT